MILTMVICRNSFVIIILITLIKVTLSIEQLAFGGNYLLPCLHCRGGESRDTYTNLSPPQKRRPVGFLTRLFRPNSPDALWYRRTNLVQILQERVDQIERQLLASRCVSNIFLFFLLYKIIFLIRNHPTTSRVK